MDLSEQTIYRHNCISLKITKLVTELHMDYYFGFSKEQCECNYPLE